MPRLAAPERIDGFDTLVLRSEDAEVEAAFVPTAGNVVASLRDGGEELLGSGKGLRRYARDGATMGIPLLHPWANRLAGDTYEAAGKRVTLPAASGLVQREEHGLPIHGLLGGSPRWEVERWSDAALHAELDFGAYPDLLAGFPFPHRLAIDATLFGRTLTIRTTLLSTGAGAVPLSFGYHPYLRLPGVPREEWRISLPVMRRLELDERSIPTGRSRLFPSCSGDLRDHAFDDGFVDVRPGAVFAVAGGGRRIEVCFDEGYRAAQVFAPPTDDVICFEPMTAPANALVSGDRLPMAGPGERYAAAFSITVDRDLL